MIFYVLLFLACFIMCLLNAMIKNLKIKKVFEIVTLILLCIISGTRYNIGGSDYLIYQKLFNSTPKIMPNITLWISNLKKMNYEIGFLILCSLVKSIGINFYGLTLIISIFFYLCMYKGLKKYIPNFNFFIIIFLYKLFFYNTFVSMRQSISIAIFFIILKYIDNHKPFKYFIGCFIAFLFHNSAIILFPLYFLNLFKINKKRYITILIVGFVFLILNLSHLLIINPQNILFRIFNGNISAIFKIETYFASGISELSIMHTIEYYAIACSVLFFYDKLFCDKNSEHNLNNNILKFFVVLILFFTIFRSFEIITRLKDYLIFTYPALLYKIIQLIKNKCDLLLYTLISIICFFGFTRYINNFDAGSLKPYKSYLNKDISIINQE